MAALLKGRTSDSDGYFPRKASSEGSQSQLVGLQGCPEMRGEAQPLLCCGHMLNMHCVTDSYLPIFEYGTASQQ